MLEYRHQEVKHIKNTLYCCYSLLKSVILVSVSPIIVTQNGMFRARAPALVCRQGWSKKFQKWTQFNSQFNSLTFSLAFRCPNV